MKIRIVSKTGCPFCEKAKTWFKIRDLDFKEEVIDDDEKRAKFYEAHGVNSVPQIFVDQERIGGYDVLEKTGEELFAAAQGGLLALSRAYKPFRYPWAVDITQRHEKIHWIEAEADLSEDVNDWKSGKMLEDEKRFIKSILRMFTQSDVAVGQNYYDLFIPALKNNEVRNMLGSFAAREGIHQRAYALLNDTLGFDDSEYSTFLRHKEMMDKITFMSASDSSTHRGLALALAKSVFNEGVTLFASFVMLLNFQRFGKMKGMGKIVEWSIRDESIHVEANARLFRAFCAEKPRVVTDEFKKEIYDIARSCVKLEDKFIDLAYGSTILQGLDAADVKKYVRYIADRRTIQLGLRGNFKVKENPLPWLEWVVNGADHSNFFETRVTEYEVGGLTGSWESAYK